MRTVHEQRRDHACSQCDAAFGQAGNLRKHVRAVHEQRPKTPCAECGETFAKQQQLSAHRRKAKTARNWSQEQLNGATKRNGGASAILEYGARSTVGGEVLFAAQNIQAVHKLVEWPTVKPGTAKTLFRTWMSERCWRETQPLALVVVKTEELK